jgi:hypothetical protein
MKRINNNISLRAILNIYNIPSIFVRTRFIIFTRSTKYPKFSSRNFLKLNKKYFGMRKKRPRCFNKRPKLKLFVSIRNKICLIRKNKK